MRYCIEYKSKLAQLENLSAFLDGRHPSSLFCQFLTSPGNKTFVVSIWFTAILWDLRHKNNYCMNKLWTCVCCSGSII